MSRGYLIHDALDRRQRVGELGAAAAANGGGTTTDQWAGQASLSAAGSCTGSVDPANGSSRRPRPNLTEQASHATTPVN